MKPKRRTLRCNVDTDARLTITGDPRWDGVITVFVGDKTDMASVRVDSAKLFNAMADILNHIREK